MTDRSPSNDRSRSISLPDGRRPSGVVGGVSFTFAWRLIDRMLSLVSTPILARLLAPEDFGLVGMASLAAGLVVVFLDLGVTAALVQQRAPATEHYDSAWTLRLIQTILVGLGVFAMAWPAASYFGEPRLVPIILVVAITSAIGGLENIGTVLFVRTFDFRSEFRFFATRRLLAFLVTMALAFALRTYWAIILGALAARMINIVLSYYYHPFRPRLSLARVGDILSFSQWSVIRGVGNYANGALPAMILGKQSGATALGVYQAAGELAFLASEEVLAPLARILYPKLVEARESLEQLHRIVTLALGVQSILAMPACVGLALVADEAVATLLGSKWNAAAPVLEILALSFCGGVIQHTGSYTMMSLGRIRVVAMLVWMEAAITGALIFSFLGHVDGVLLATIRLATALSTATAYAVLLHLHPVGLPISKIVASLTKPLLSCGVMAVCLIGLTPWFPTNPFAALPAKIVVGALAYVVSLFGLWVLAGRPDGAETYILDKLQDVRSRIMARLRSDRR